jgi:hypothetical protein
MDPSEQPPLEETIMSCGHARVLERKRVRIVSDGLLPPIKKNARFSALFTGQKFCANTAWSKIIDGASICFVDTNMSHATFEIRDMNVSIGYELSLYNCKLTLINCCINAIDIDKDVINVYGGSHLKLVECNANNCKIYVKADLTGRTAKMGNLNPPKDTSATIEAHNCSLRRIELYRKARGVFTNCELEEKIPSTATTNSNNVFLRTESVGKFINCQIGWLHACRNSKVFIIDSSVDSALCSYSSLIKMKNSTIKSKTRQTIITTKSTLNAHNLTIELLPTTAGENLYDRFATVNIDSSLARFTGNLNFVFDENIPETRSDITITGSSTVILPQTINANLLPIFFMTGGRIYYPERLQIDVPGIERNEFHKILMSSLVPADESKRMFMLRRSALPFIKLSKDLRINYQGRLFYKSPATLDDMSENEIAYAKSLIPSRAFLASKGVRVSKELMNNKAFFSPLSIKVHTDFCSKCHNPKIPCDAVADCGHTYHERCYLTMVSQAQRSNCTICGSRTQIINIRK